MSEAAELVKPWEKPFWKPAKGKGAILFYLVLIHVLAIIGLILYPTPSLPVIGLTLLVPAAAAAQSAIAGIVRDATGGVLPGVTVEASSPKIRAVA